MTRLDVRYFPRRQSLMRKPYVEAGTRSLLAPTAPAVSQ